MSRLRYVAIVVAYTVVFWGLLPGGAWALGRWLDRVLGLSGGAILTYVGIPLGALGLWVCVHSIMVLKRRGQGLPISSLPPKRLVTSGPYRYVRHPIYSGAFLLFVGLALVVRSPAAAFLVAPASFVVWVLTWVRLFE